jgi:hypothetical protein
MYLLSILTLISFVLSLSIIFGYYFTDKINEKRKINLIGILVGVAISPHILTIYTSIIFTLNFAPKFLGFLCIIPLFLFSFILIFFYFKTNILLIFLEIKKNFKLFLNLKNNFTIKITSIFSFFLCLVFLVCIIYQSRVFHFDHDISIYLNEASLLVKSLKQGNSIINNPILLETRYPHSIFYTIYLGWGFSIFDAPVFGVDLVPKLQVGLNHISALAGAIFFCFYKNRSYFKYLFIAAAILLLDYYSWTYQLRALSRDTYYLGPLFIISSFILHSKPWDQKINNNIFITSIVFFIFLISALTGHSLGVFYLSCFFLAISSFHLLRYKLRVFLIVELWIVGIVLLIFFFIKYQFFFLSDSQNLGFYYTYYNLDPALYENWKNTQKSWTSEPSLFAILDFIIFNKIPKFIIFPLLLSALLIFKKSFNKVNFSVAEYKWMYLTFSNVLIILIIVFLPLKLDGISLSNAFSSNFRYGFGINLGLLILTILSTQIIYENKRFLLKIFSNKYQIKFSKLLIKFTVLIFLFIFNYHLYNIGNKFIDDIKKKTTNKETILTKSLNQNCKRFIKIGIRNILVDDRRILYFCNQNSFFIYSKTFEKLILAQNDDEFNSLLDKKQIDVILLNDKWWLNARLHRFVKKNWIKCKKIFREGFYYRSSLYDKSLCK